MCLEVNIKCDRGNTKVNILREDDKNDKLKMGECYFKINELASLLEQHIITSYYNKEVNHLTIEIKEE